MEGVPKTIKNKTKEENGGFLSMLSGTLGVSFLGNLLAGKVIVRAGSGNKKGKGIVTVVMEMKWIFNTVSSFDKLWNTKYYQSERRFNGVYSRNIYLKK